MSRFLNQKPYAPRDEGEFLEEMKAINLHHLENCETYRRIWPGEIEISCLEDLPYLHVGVFKHLDLVTRISEGTHKRTLLSSATSSGTPSKIHLDSKSSDLQARSTTSILKDFLGEIVQPLLILDSSATLLNRGQVSARVAAAMSLQPMASQLYFILENSEDPGSIKWDELLEVAENSDSFIVYGFSWILWLAWGAAVLPQRVQRALSGKRITFVHSGGWKKLEANQVSRAVFDKSLKQGLHPGSQVIDFYGLVEQVGIIFPLCPCGYRIAPAWADVLVRDLVTHEVLTDQPGQLQLMNTISYGAPYHNVLTEDLGRIIPQGCQCGRAGTVFELIGRIPHAEIRGCANA